MADRPSIAESLKRRAEANAANADKDPFAGNGDGPPAESSAAEPAARATAAPRPTPAPVAAAVKEETVKLTVVIPETVNHRLKMKAVGDRTNIAALVRIWIDDYLAAP